MTAEQLSGERLEELPADVAEVIRHLTTRVLAAEKLVEAAAGVFEDPTTLGDMLDLHNALTAYREARK